MLLDDLVAVSAAVTSTRSRIEKTELLADLLGRLSVDEAPMAVSYLAGAPMQRRLGVGYATVHATPTPAADQASLQIVDVHRTFEELAATAGPGSKARRSALLEDLLSRATAREQDFLQGLIVKNLRQGALEGVMADAVARAVGVPAERVRRAAMLQGDLVSVATLALVEGPGTLAATTVNVFTPLQPMLAGAAESAGQAVSELGDAVVETKLDGLRLQVHRAGDRVEVYTRNLRNVTVGMAGIVAAALELEASSFILDGEGLMVDSDGRPLSFQDSMSRPDRGGERPLRAFFFDILHLDGVDLIDEPLAARRQELAGLVPSEWRARSIVTVDPAEADRFFDEAVAAGDEGVVVKDPMQPYEAGRRGSGWLKVKPTYTLDLVILAAEWGSGRRQGWLSNLHLGARDDHDRFVMLGKTFKGLTDEMLEWQTSAFLDIETGRDGHVVMVEPRIVYEIAFDGVQRSTRYPGGVALRFARVKAFREDKHPSDADTIEAVRSYLR